MRQSVSRSVKSSQTLDTTLLYAVVDTYLPAYLPPLVIPSTGSANEGHRSHRRSEPPPLTLSLSLAPKQPALSRSESGQSCGIIERRAPYDAGP